MGKKTSNLLKGLAVVSLLCLGMASAAKADTLSGFTEISGVGIQFTNAIVWLDGSTPSTTGVFGATSPFNGTTGQLLGTGVDQNACNSTCFNGTVGGFSAWSGATVIFGGAYSTTNSGPVGIELLAGGVASPPPTPGSSSDGGDSIYAFSYKAGDTPLYTLGAGPTATFPNFNTSLPNGFTQFTGPNDDVCQESSCNDGDTITVKQFGDFNVTTGAACTSGTANCDDIFTATDTSIGYVIAIPTTASTTTIPSTPEPSSLLMLGSGLLGLFGLGLRRKVEV